MPSLNFDWTGCADRSAFVKVWQACWSDVPAVNSVALFWGHYSELVSVPTTLIFVGDTVEGVIYRIVRKVKVNNCHDRLLLAPFSDIGESSSY